MSAHERPCHYHELFIRTTGEVYPCCDIAIRRPEFVIGLIDEPNIADKIEAFKGTCECHRGSLRGGLPGELPRYVYFYVELDLKCHSDCPMCYANAPSWKGTYNHYDDVTRLIEKYRPMIIKVMGGEVLIQKQSLNWCHELKNAYPQMKLCLITNGNYPLSRLDEVETLFDNVGISSILGFQPETHKLLTGLNLARTLRFAEVLVARKKVSVAIAYLSGPSGFHEMNLFLRWAVNVAPDRVHVADMNVEKYVRLDTDDRYWHKVFERTAKLFRDDLIKLKDVLNNNETVVWISPHNMRLLNITDEFIAENDLSDKVFVNQKAYNDLFEFYLKHGVNARKFVF